jgi:Phosphatidylethanolamine-binding protein
LSSDRSDNATRPAEIGFQRVRWHTDTDLTDTSISCLTLPLKNLVILQRLPKTIGHALQGQRAGFGKVLFNLIDFDSVVKFEVLSLSFAANAALPSRYTDDGESISPPLQWRAVLEATTTLVLIVEDADSMTPQPLVHAIAIIDPKCEGLAEGELREDARAGSPVNLGRNSYLRRALVASRSAARARRAPVCVSILSVKGR